MGALEYVDVPGYAAIIFRRTFADLALPGAIMARSKEWLTNTDAKWNEQSKQWRFPSGAVLQFAYMEHADDELRYQGAEFQYVGFDELTQFPEEQYTYLFSRLRRPRLDEATTEDERERVEALGKVPLRARSASNPGGVGHGWVKKRFPIDGQPRGRRVFIPAKMQDNPHGDAVAYRASLSHLSETLRQQLEEGDWNVAEGLAYMVTAEHLVDEFPLDDSYDRFEAADYGFAGAPWALWCTDYEQNLVAYDMVYERDKLPSAVAEIVLRMRASSWGESWQAVIDPSVWKRMGSRNRWGAPAMLADEFIDAGVNITPANNDPRAGMARIRELLKIDPDHRFPSWHQTRAGQLGAPRIFFTPQVSALVQELRDAPVQPFNLQDGGEKVDPKWEGAHGHAAAMCRYAVLTRPAPSTPKPEVELDMRRAAMQKALAAHDRDVAREPDLFSLSGF